MIAYVIGSGGGACELISGAFVEDILTVSLVGDRDEHYTPHYNQYQC